MPCTPRKQKSGVKVLATALVFDLVLSASIVGGDYLYNYVLPHGLSAAGTAAYAASESGQADWQQKFASHFSRKIVSTDTVYKSPHISIEFTHKRYDSGSIDRSAGGMHTKYGSQISYTRADIYVANIDCLRTAFAQDTYGVGFSEPLADMSARMKSVLATNGDSYSNNRHEASGTIIRNGTVYRSKPSTEETCVLFRDGTMATYAPDEFDPQAVIDKGAWQSWIFGPSLLDSQGHAKRDFLTWNYIRESHPRTAIGYYEPGHYCLLVVDGRQPGTSRGMTLEEMSQLFANLGCKVAYNLDGGHCAFMTKGNQVVSDPYRPGKSITDGIFICEPTARH